MTDGISESAVDMKGRSPEEFARDQLRRRLESTIDDDGPQLRVELKLGHDALLGMSPGQRHMLETGLALIESALHSNGPASLANAVHSYLEPRL